MPTRRGGVLKPMLIAVLVIVAVGVLWLCVEIYFAVTAKPNVDTDYASKMQELAASVQGDGPNRWGELADLLAEFESLDAAVQAEFDSLTVDAPDRIPIDARLLTDEQGQLERIRNSSGDGYSGKLSEAQEIEQARLAQRLYADAVAAMESDGMLDQMRELRASDAVVVRPYRLDAPLVEALLPELGTMRTLCRWLEARAVLAAEAGEWEDAEDSIASMVWLAETAESEPFLISGLVSIALHALALETTREIVLERELPSAALARFAEMFDAWRPPSFAHALAGEQLLGMDAIQRTHDARGRLMLSQMGGAGRNGGGPKVMNVASVFMPRRGTTERTLEEYFDTARRFIELPPADRADAEALSAELDALVASNRFLALPAPELDKSAQNYDRIESERTGVRVLVAIERFRAERGAPPNELSELVPDFLASLPLDIWSPISEFEYRRDDSELGYVLYSVGADGTDDGGSPAEYPVEALLPGLVTGEGTDYLFTRPPR